MEQHVIEDSYNKEGANEKALNFAPMGSYSQHFIFFVI
jgi:hypothetical protein